MKVTVFNDTRVDWVLHIGSERGSKGERRIPKRDAVEFEVPEDNDVFVKVWGKMAMVRYVSPDHVPAHQAVRTPFTPRRRVARWKPESEPDA